jgi:hypothetical protein
MNERNALTEELAGTSPTPAPEHASALEGRVRTLEKTVAILQDTGKLEERIVERVTKRVESQQTNSAILTSANLLTNAGKHLLPAAVGALQAHVDAVEAQARVEGAATPQPLLIVDIYSELRAMVSMFLDSRYRRFLMTWQTKVFPLVLLGLMIVSWLWLASLIPGVLATVLDKAVELVLAFFLYKILSREARRYREISKQLPPLRSSSPKKPT